MEEALENARNEIEKILMELKEESPRLFDVKELKKRSLIIWHRILFFWCADAIIRLRGVKEPVKDWSAVYSVAIDFGKNLTIDTAAKLLLQTGDRKSIETLLRIRRDLLEALRELNKLINATPTLRSFLKYIDSANLEEGDNLAAHAKNTYNKWAKEYNARTVPTKHRDLKDRIRFIPPKNEKDTPQRESPIYEANDEIIAHYDNFYRTNVNTTAELYEVNYVPCPLAASIPLPSWDAVAPIFWQEDITKALKYLEPGIGDDYFKEWKKMPYRAVRKAAHFTERIEPLNGSEEKVKDLYITDDESGGLTGRRDIGHIEPLDPFKKEDLRKKFIEALEITFKEEKIRKPHLYKDTILLLFDACLAGDQIPNKSACKIAGLSYSAFKEFFPKFAANLKRLEQS